MLSAKSIIPQFLQEKDNERVGQFFRFVLCNHHFAKRKVPDGSVELCCPNWHGFRLRLLFYQRSVMDADALIRFSGKQQQLRCTTRLIYFIITLHSFQLWLLLVLMLGWICNKRCVLQCLLLFKQTHPHQSVNKGFRSKQNKKHLSRWGNQVYTGAKWLCENTELSRSPESPLSHRTTDIWKLRKWFTSCVFEKKKILKFRANLQTFSSIKKKKKFIICCPYSNNSP